MFCPQTVVWGDVASWVSAVSSTALGVAAILVAVYIHRFERRAHREQQRRELARTRVITGLIAPEIGLLAGRMQRLSEALRAYAKAPTPQGIDVVGISTLASNWQPLLPLVNAHLADLDGLEPQLAGEIGALAAIMESLLHPFLVRITLMGSNPAADAVNGPDGMRILSSHRAAEVYEIAHELAKRTDSFAARARAAYVGLQRTAGLPVAPEYDEFG